MPSPKPTTQRKGKAPARSMSFHDSRTLSPSPSQNLRRPKTVPNLPSSSRIIYGGAGPMNYAEGGARPRLTKLLFNVTIQKSLGPVQVILSPESTVGNLIAAAVKLYVKEGRRPVLPTSDPEGFNLHYSQFSLESLDREEQLLELGSRNFFLCKRNPNPTSSSSSSPSPDTCSKQAAADKATTTTTPWLKFISFLHH